MQKEVANSWSFNSGIKLFFSPIGVELELQTNSDAICAQARVQEIKIRQLAQWLLT